MSNVGNCFISGVHEEQRGVARLMTLRDLMARVPQMLVAKDEMSVLLGMFG